MAFVIETTQDFGSHQTIAPETGRDGIVLVFRRREQAEWFIEGMNCVSDWISHRVIGLEELSKSAASVVSKIAPQEAV